MANHRELLSPRAGRWLLSGVLLTLPFSNAGAQTTEAPAPADLRDQSGAMDVGRGLRLPAARDDLLAQTDPSKVPSDRAPASKGGVDALLADDNLDEPAEQTRYFGFDQLEVAYTLPHPAHFSKLENRLELGAQGAFTPDVKWKVSGRLDYNAIYDLSSFYSSQVKDDGRINASFRETFLDVGAGDFDFRFGRQQIVWGEVVGLFVADVVSAKDLRESLAQDFDLIRIPQWAARAEYFKNDIHLEAIWIPFPSVDEIGKPGGDFYPYPPPPPPGYAFVINNEVKPREDASQENFGVRASILRDGWDVAAFAYRSVDAQQTFFRQIVAGPVPAFVFTPSHEKITQYGSTVSKDFDDFVFKAEAVYTVGQNFNVTRLSDGDGVVSQDYLDYILSFEFPMANDSRINAQFFQRIFKDHDPDIIPRKVESGVTLFWSGKWGKLEPQILAIHSLDQSDWLLRPKLIWNFARDWRSVFGADVFGGSPTGLFGQFNKKDRVYAELRRSF